MIRTLASALFACVLLAGCGGQDTSFDPARTQAKYLPWNADHSEIQTTSTGLQYIVLKEGSVEAANPTATDMVRVNYEGWTAEKGEKFDSSYDRGSPAVFKLNQVIAGWTLGLQEMTPGDVYLFHVPNALAYGPQDRGDVIKAGDDLVFQIELLNVLGESKSDTAAWEAHTPWNSDHPDVIKTESGLEYIILENGDTAGPSPVNGEQVVVYYEGRLAESGEVFDSAFARGAPEIFPSNRLIRGWVEALAMMKPGDRWIMFIPSDLGYGARGTPGGPIPPNADLMFEVEMVDVLKKN